MSNFEYERHFGSIDFFGLFSIYSKSKKCLFYLKFDLDFELSQNITLRSKNQMVSLLIKSLTI